MDWQAAARGERGGREGKRRDVGLAPTTRSLGKNEWKAPLHDLCGVFRAKEAVVLTTELDDQLIA